MQSDADRPKFIDSSPTITNVSPLRSNRDPEQWQNELTLELEANGFWVPLPDAGHPPSSSSEWRQVVDEVRRLHQFGRGHEQRPGTVESARLGARLRRGAIGIGATGADAEVLVETALARLAYGQTTLVCGNVSADNIRIAGQRVGFVDWSDARVDAPEFDLGPLGVLRGRRAEVAAAAVAARAVAEGPADRSARWLDHLAGHPIPAWPAADLRDGDVRLRVRTLSDVTVQLEGEDHEMERWLTGQASTAAEIQHHIEATARLWTLGGLRLVWGIDADGLAGTMAINLADIDLAPGEANLSYGLFPRARGRGTVTVALELAVGYLAALGEVDTAILKIDPNNTRSINVAKRCGFDPDGVITTNTDTFTRWRRDLC